MPCSSPILAASCAHDPIRCGSSSCRATRCTRRPTSVAGWLTSRCCRRRARVSGCASRRRTAWSRSRCRCPRSTGRPSRRPSYRSSRAGGPSRATRSSRSTATRGVIAFARSVLGAAPTTATADPFEAVRADWSSSAALAAAHRAATGAAHGAVALDLALTLAWPAIAGAAVERAVRGAAGRARARRPCGEPGAGVAASARRARARGGAHRRRSTTPTAAPTRMTCRAVAAPWRARRARDGRRRLRDVRRGAGHRSGELPPRGARRRAHADHGGRGGLAGRAAVVCGSRHRRRRSRARKVDCTTDVPRAGGARRRARGVMLRARRPWWRRSRGDGAPGGADVAHPVRAAVARLAPAGPPRHPRPRVPLAEAAGQRAADHGRRSRASAATTTRCIAACSPRGSPAWRGRSCTAPGRRRARRRSSSTRSARATPARCGAGG